MRRWWLGSVVLAAAVVALFLPAVDGGWLNLDDERYVLANPLVRGGFGLQGVLGAFGSTRGSLWIPLAWVSHMLDVSLFGVDAAGHHLTNVLLHGVNAAVLFLVLARLTGAPGRSAVVAAIFAVHPLRVESVAWIAERKDLLVALFAWLTIDAYRRWTEQPNARRYGLVVGCYALALAAKPMAVTLPLLLCLLDVWPLRRAESRPASYLLLEKAPLFAMAAAGAALTLAIAGRRGILANAHTPGERMGNVIVSYVRYPAFMAWPADLAVFYPFPPPWPLATVLAAAAVLGTVGLGAWALRRRAPYVGVGYLWYLVALVPVIGFVQAGGQGMADRFTYLPMVGVLVAVVWAMADLVGRRPPRLAVAGFAVGVVVGLLAGQTRVQLGHWRTAEALYAHTLRVTRGNWLINHNLGELELRRHAYEEAIRHFEAALAIEPRYASAAYNLGLAEAGAGRPEEAVASYQRALAIDPSLAQAHNNLGVLLLQAGERDAALGHFATAMRLDPTLRSADANFRHALAAGGMPPDVIERFVRTALGGAGQPRQGHAPGAGESFDQ